MSVLIKRTDSSSGGGSSKGYPPGNVTNVTIKGGNKKVTIKWTDPDDVVIGDKTLSTWQSTTLVRKKGSIPTSIKDGVVILETTEKNKYKNTEYSDNNLDIGTYYYRFFVCNTDKIYNNDSGMIYSAAVVEFDPILSNNSWDQIAAASESGIASDIWNIGDEIDLTLSGTYNETVTLQIWDFNHFDKSDGSGKAGICFGMKNLMKEENCLGYPYWSSCTMRTTYIPKIISSMPIDLQNVLKKVNTYANEGDAYVGKVEKGTLSKDKVFIPGSIEVFGKWSSEQYNTEAGQTQFPIFTDNNSRIKKLSGNNNMWFLRSTEENETNIVIFVDYDGNMFYNGAGYVHGYNADVSGGVCFCFNV